MTVCFLGFYSKDNYQLLLKTADDRKTLDDKWEDWLSNYLKAKSGLVGEGVILEETFVNVTQMINYFKEKRLKNNGKNRAEYITTIGTEEYKKKTNN